MRRIGELEGDGGIIDGLQDEVGMSTVFAVVEREAVAILEARQSLREFDDFFSFDL